VNKLHTYSITEEAMKEAVNIIIYALHNNKYNINPDTEHSNQYKQKSDLQHWKTTNKWATSTCSGKETRK
jgi:hypothetical protein